MRRLPIDPKALLTYTVIVAFSFILWIISIVLWYQLYNWYLWVTEPTALFTVLVLPIPYLVYLSLATPAEGGQRFDLFRWAKNWLEWMGNGETQRGTLVLMVVVFWSMLFWSWPQPDIRSLPFTLTFPGWGLLTIFGMVAIRSLFFRQTTLPKPGAEVPAADPKKSSSKP